jgi:hypothetical protein
MQELTLENKNGSFRNATKIIYNDHGLIGFYSGITPRLIGIIPMRIVYWTTMIKMNTLVINEKPIIKYLLPGLIAGSIQTIIDNPIEILKIQLMTKEKHIKLKINNIKNLYVGFTASLLRNSIFAIVVSSIVNVNTNYFKNDNKFIVGAFGGLLGSILSHPFDTIKTELQRFKNIQTLSTTSINTFDVFFKIIKNNPKKLWAGMEMRCLLAFFNMGIGFYTLELVNKLFFYYIVNE